MIEREAKYGYVGWGSDNDDSDVFNGADDNDDGDDEYFDDDDDDNNNNINGGYYGGEEEDNDDERSGEGFYNYDECEDPNSDDYFSMDCYDVEDDESDDSSESSSGSRRSPLDDVDVHTFLKRVFQVMSGEVYIRAVRLLSPEQKATIAGFLKS